MSEHDPNPFAPPSSMPADVESYQILDFGKLVGLRYVPVWLASSIPFVGGFLALIDILFIFREDRRCVHDMIAGTVVVEA